MRTKGWMALLSGLLVIACSSCSHNQKEASPTTGTSTGVAANEGSASGPSVKPAGLYSRYNLHYYSRGDTNIASYANYTDCPNHAFLPYNTRFKVGSWGKGFKLTAADTGMVILFEYRSDNMGGMSTQDYINLILSPSPVSYSSLTPEDQEGIKAGKALVGMSKEGVKIALGYPAKHKTPSTDLNTWVYWKGRFNMLTVDFGENGKVGSLR